MVVALLLAAASALFGRRMAARKLVIAMPRAGRVARRAGLVLSGVLVPGVLVAILTQRHPEVVVLDIALWAAQGLLALFFLAAGLPKVAGRGLDRWVGFEDFSRGLTILIGVSEVVGAVALVLPSLLGAFEWTIPLAAIGIAVISLMASGFHVRAAERICTIETALLAALAGSIAIGRWGETASAPAVPAGVLVVVIALLVPSIVAVLVVLVTRPVGQGGAAGAQRVAAG
jgi:hypothetical protein